MRGPVRGRFHLQPIIVISEGLDAQFVGVEEADPGVERQEKHRRAQRNYKRPASK